MLRCFRIFGVKEYSKPNQKMSPTHVSVTLGSFCWWGEGRSLFLVSLSFESDDFRALGKPQQPGPCAFFSAVLGDSSLRRSFQIADFCTLLWSNVSGWTFLCLSILGKSMGRFLVPTALLVSRSRPNRVGHKWGCMELTIFYRISPF